MVLLRFAELLLVGVRMGGGWCVLEEVAGFEGAVVAAVEGCSRVPLTLSSSLSESLSR